MGTFRFKSCSGKKERQQEGRKEPRRVEGKRRRRKIGRRKSVPSHKEHTISWEGRITKENMFK